MVIPGQVCFGPAESWRMISDKFSGLKQLTQTVFCKKKSIHSRRRGA